MPHEPCSHDAVECLNQFELIRKYRCVTCAAVMMCACDEEIGRRFLPHQLRFGAEAKTQARVPVTIGFQPTICNGCRGLPEVAAPKSPLRGATSKFRRYYWREIAFERMRRFARFAEEHGEADATLARDRWPDEEERIRKEVIVDLQRVYRDNPKYSYSGEPQEELFAATGVCPLRLDATYQPRHDGRAAVILDGKIVSVEAFVASHFAAEGFETLELESRPLHALFATYLWYAIQDPEDPNVRVVSFARSVADESDRSETVRLCHPSDFGTVGYGERRRTELDSFFQEMLVAPDDLLQLFDYWQGPSEGLRRYLHANDVSVVARARRLAEVLPREALLRVLRYLVDSYWERYLGWPDLFIWRGRDYRFVEVKSSNDELRPNQAAWIRANANILHLPFTLVKVHRAGRQ